MTTALSEKDTETMDFEAFVETVRGDLQERYPDCGARIMSVQKNNGVCRTGIGVFPDGRTFAPTIYMEDCYEAYLDGRPLDEIVSDCVLCCEKEMARDIQMPDIRDFHAVRDIISCRLVNWERNSELLDEMPHRRFLNLALTYYIPTAVEEPNDGKIAVTDQLVSLWGVDEETLYRCALENTRRRLPIKLQTLEEVVREMMGKSYPEGLSGNRDGIPCPPIYILQRIKGGESTAAVLLEDDILREFAAEHGNFYVLPSSISEVLLVPERYGCPDAGYYNGMVREVNRTQVEPEDFLSDNAYYYYADSGRLEILF